MTVKETYFTEISGTKYLMTEFKKRRKATASYQVSSTLTGWGAPGTGGRPTITETVSPLDLSVAVVRINQPAVAGSRYFIRALGQRPAMRSIMDFDGDGKTDWSVVRNTGGGPTGAITWFIALSGGGSLTQVFGQAGDFFVPADYDGDDKADIAIWRANQFQILQSSDGATRIVNLGVSGDEPTVMGDYDGDGKDDPAVYRKVGGTAHFIYLGSAGGGLTDVSVGPNTSPFPNPGDYDADGKTDFCVQASTGFYLRRSTDGGTEIFSFGTATDVVTSGDNDGDDKADTITIRGTGGVLQWSVLERDGGTPAAVTLGTSATDYLAPGDYDGDGKIDFGVWKPGTPAVFSVRRSSDGVTMTFEWGQTGDYPVAKSRTH